jgi:hypothetical protein
MKYVFVTHEGADLFPVRETMEAAIAMVMQRALIFDLTVQAIEFDRDETKILLYDEKNDEFHDYIIERCPFANGII